MNFVAIDDIFITATDTDVGKTLVSSWLALHLNTNYYKPIQSGKPTDSDVVRAHFANIKTNNIVVQESFLFKESVSPHIACSTIEKQANIEKIVADLADYKKLSNTKFIIEGAGGIMSPINNKQVVLDVILALKKPIIVVAKNKLGTINHTILTIEKLKESNANILGIIINSQDDFGSQSEKINALNCKYIEDYTGVKILATLPFIGKVNTRTLLSISMPKSLVNKVSL